MRLELLKRVLTAALLIPVVLVLVLHAPVPVLAFIAGVVALLAIQELLKLAEAYGIKPLRRTTNVFCALFFIGTALNPGVTPLLSTGTFVFGALAAAFFSPFIFLAIGMSRAELTSAFPAAMVSSFSFLYIALPLSSLVQLRGQWRGAFLLLYLLLLVWAGDIFAYFVGKPFGTHRMSPRVSPNKTWEGATASLLASVGVGILMFHYAVPISSALFHAHLIEQRDGIFTSDQIPLAE